MDESHSVGQSDRPIDRCPQDRVFHLEVLALPAHSSRAQRAKSTNNGAKAGRTAASKVLHSVTMAFLRLVTGAFLNPLGRYSMWLTHKFRMDNFLLVAIGMICLTWPTAAQEPVPMAVSLEAPLVLYSPAEELGPDDPGSIGGPLSIELVRQAILIAARDELGLRTLDPVLGEAGEGGGVVGIGLDMRLIQHEGTALRLALGDKQLLDTSYPQDWGKGRALIAAVQQFEALSRTEFVQVLGQAGLAGRAHTWHDTAGVPAKIQALVDEMSLIPQFRAARALHALIAEDGESPERLYALSRVYANLGQECRWYIRCEYATFFARSLLYAQRLRVKAPGHVLGELATAHAWTFAGFPNWSRPSLTKLDEVIAAADQPPAWASLVRLLWACYEYNPDVLRPAMEAGGPEAQIAALWNVKTVEFNELTGTVFQAIEDSFEVNPGSLRNIYPAYEAMGITTGHRFTEAIPEIFGAVTADQFSRIDDLPPDLQRAVGPIDDEALDLLGLSQLSRALIDASVDGGDPSELSYAVLGTLIEEANALHVLYRARFMRRMWGVDTSEYLDQTIGAIEQHPYAPLILTFLLPQESQHPLMGQLMASFEPTYLNTYHVGTFIWHLPDGPVFANGEDENWFWSKTTEMRNSESSTWLLMMCLYWSDSNAEWRANLASWMSVSDTNNPMRRSMLIRHRDLPEQALVNLGIRYGHHPIISFALSVRMEANGNLQAARDYAELSADLAPERLTLEQLARLQLLMGDEEQWLATMTAALDLPDMGLDHDEINRTIAKTYMNANRYEEALPYAQAAAESWSARAFHLSIVCLSSLGHHEEAEAIALRAQRRYGYPYWKEWALWSGQGDRATLIELLDEVTRSEFPNRAWLVALNLVRNRIITGQYEQAFDLVEARDAEAGVTLTSRELLQAVCLAQHLRLKDKRDAYLDRLIAFPPEDGERLRFALLGDILKRGLEDGRMDLEAVQAWIETHDDEFASEWTHHGLWFMVSMGGDNRDYALERLSVQCRLVASMGHTGIAWCRSVARANGLAPEKMRPMGFAGAHELP